MFVRSLTAFFAVSLLLTGCAVSTDPTDEGESSSESQAARICPMVYAPVCGKDGKTYGNECQAGGKGRVAHDGECTACDSTRCARGETCQLTDTGEAVCVADVDACAAVRCASGTHCEVKPDGSAGCVADEPITSCAAVLCVVGTTCYETPSGPVCR